jgi:hypothetical protein
LFCALLPLFCAQLYNASAAAVASLPELTTLVPVGSIGATLASTLNANTSNSSSISSSSGNSSASKREDVLPHLASRSSTARQFEVQLNFTLLPGSSNSSKGRPAHSVYSQDSAAITTGTAGAAAAATAAAAAASSGSKDAGPALQPDEFAVGVRLLLSNPSNGFNSSGSYVDIYLKGVVAQLPAHVSPSITALSVWVNRSNAGPSSNTTYMEGGPVPLPVETLDAWLLPDQQLQLSVWVDHSVIEVFGMGGSARVTSRVYPEDDDVAWGVSSWVKLPSQLQILSQSRSASTEDASGSSSSSSYIVVEGKVGRSVGKHGGLWAKLYCWWCKLWYQQCSCQCEGDGTADPRCAARSSSSSSMRDLDVQQQQQQQRSSTAEVEVGWSVTADGAVWEVKNAWLPPSC